jgi:hypothetical protein
MTFLWKPKLTLHKFRRSPPKKEAPITTKESFLGKADLTHGTKRSNRSKRPFHQTAILKISAHFENHQGVSLKNCSKFNVHQAVILKNS